MKTLKTICYVSIILASLCYIVSNPLASLTARAEKQDIPETMGQPVPGMYFSSEHVVDFYEDGYAYYLVYTDFDAGLVNALIKIDRVTWDEYNDSYICKQIIDGTLMCCDISQEDGSMTYALVFDEED